jgi:hypothetical protein
MVTTTTKTAAYNFFAAGQKPGCSQNPPNNTEERLERIEVMGQHIAGHIGFMCQVTDLQGSSPEAKERAVIRFYERILIVEKQLGRIREEFQLE